MAGSFSKSAGENSSDLSSRLEGLTLLANHLSDPVVIFDSKLELIYSNASAHAIAARCPLLAEQVNARDEFNMLTSARCETCPAENILAQGHQHSQMDEGGSLVHHQDPACPFPTLFPLSGLEEGAATCVVMMGKVPEDTVAWRGSPGGGAVLPSTAKQRPTLIGESEVMQQLLEMIRLVAVSESTVLIQGESGTGKELVAKTIHQLSPRRDRPFVVVECSSLPETLLESELFGHVRGAFTGAVTDRKGLFEEAEGGTIFLDEISDTVPSFQAKLLRVLQEGEIKPVGSNRSIKVNVRVISASNKSLMHLIEERTFRSDLYYRLAVLPLSIPSLRERPEDISLLVQHFLAQSCTQNKKPRLSVPASTMNYLIGHDWPGNVRELENVIERAVVLTRGSELTIQDIFDSPPDAQKSSDLPSMSKAARQAVEKQEILKALQETQGDKTRAARRLKISRASLYNKLKIYQL